MKKNIALILLVAILIPFPTYVVPKWEVKVVNQNRKPQPEKLVTQEWSSSPLVGISSETKVTNADGVAFFPARKNYSPLLVKAPIWFLNGVNYLLMHGSPIFGSAVVREKESGNYIRYYHDKDLKEDLIIKD